MSIKSFLENIAGPLQQNGSHENIDTMMATAVIFLEMANADFVVKNEEIESVKKSLSTFFDLSEEELDDLVRVAQSERAKRNDIWLFTNQIKQQCDFETKMAIIEMLWKLVYADGTMDKYEDALMRKIANLFALSHQEMISAKLKVKDQMGL